MMPLHRKPIKLREAETSCIMHSKQFKDTHREKDPSNKTLAPVCTLNQLFIRGSLTETKLSKKSSYWQKSVLSNRPIL